MIISALCHCSPLYLDIVPFSILHALRTNTRPKLELGGIAPWLQNISNFTGDFYKMYFHTELTGVLNYIKDCLSCGQVVEVCILKQILAKMSGWNPPENLTGKMLNCLSGGPKLKEIAYNLGEARKKAEKSSAALCNQLFKPLNGELSCAIELIILAGQQAQQILYKASTEHLKLLGSLYDNLVSCIIQLVDLLTFESNNENEKYKNLLPENSIVSLVQDYSIPLPLTMYIVRPSIDFSKFDNIKQQMSQIGNSQLPIELYSMFWALSLSDIRSTEAQYDFEIKQLQDSLAPQSEMDKVRTNELVRKLDSEKAFLKFRHNMFTNLIKKTCNLEGIEQFASLFVKECVYPRVLCSPSDALYSVYFIETLHKLQVPGFPTLEVVYECLGSLVACVHCITEGEAANIGLFLLELIALLKRWQQSFRGVFKAYKEEDFSKNLNFYYRRLTNVLCACFKSKSYIVQRNALQLLSKVFREFPLNLEQANKILEALHPVKSSELKDLKLLSQRFYDNLQNKFVSRPPKRQNHKQDFKDTKKKLPQKRKPDRSPESKRDKRDDDRRRFYKKHDYKYDKSKRRPS